ncbi:uncharacterized protein METZ01_LOCUS198695 [marine metagenome]|uniref:Uncharacterized protein n=1 Tax=marine metagenome TaxID=408172 RepID=A0A382E771_9ZZZZ
MVCDITITSMIAGLYCNAIYLFTHNIRTLYKICYSFVPVYN